MKQMRYLICTVGHSSSKFYTDQQVLKWTYLNFKTSIVSSFGVQIHRVISVHTLKPSEFHLYTIKVRYLLVHVGHPVLKAIEGNVYFFREDSSVKIVYLPSGANRTL